MLQVTIDERSQRRESIMIPTAERAEESKRWESKWNPRQFRRLWGGNPSTGPTLQDARNVVKGNMLYVSVSNNQAGWEKGQRLCCGKGLLFSNMGTWALFSNIAIRYMGHKRRILSESYVILSWARTTSKTGRNKFCSLDQTKQKLRGTKFSNNYIVIYSEFCQTRRTASRIAFL